MRIAPLLAGPLMALLVLPLSAWPQQPLPGSAARVQGYEQVRVTTRIVVVDRDALTRAGLEYAVIGNDRVVVRSARRSAGSGVRVKAGTHGVTAFLEAVRDSRWVRSETTQQVLALSGRPATVSSRDLSMGRRASRSTGPVLSVIPTVLPDGGIHLQVSARHEDEARYGWGYSVDGSPASVDTELVAPDGEEILLASSTGVQQTREGGLLSWGSGEHGRDVLIALTAEVVSR